MKQIIYLAILAIMIACSSEEVGKEELKYQIYPSHLKSETNFVPKSINLDGYVASAIIDGILCNIEYSYDYPRFTLVTKASDNSLVEKIFIHYDNESYVVDSIHYPNYTLYYKYNSLRVYKNSELIYNEADYKGKTTFIDVTINALKYLCPESSNIAFRLGYFPRVWSLPIGVYDYDISNTTYNVTRFMDIHYEYWKY